MLLVLSRLSGNVDINPGSTKSPKLIGPGNNRSRFESWLFPSQCDFPSVEMTSRKFSF